MVSLNRKQAYQIDKEFGAYSEFDEETGMFCVFGAQSGFCYGTFLDVGAASDYGVELHEELMKYARP